MRVTASLMIAHQCVTTLSAPDKIPSNSPELTKLLPLYSALEFWIFPVAWRPWHLQVAIIQSLSSKSSINSADISTRGFSLYESAILENSQAHCTSCSHNSPTVPVPGNGNIEICVEYSSSCSFLLQVLWMFWKLLDCSCSVLLQVLWMFWKLLDWSIFFTHNQVYNTLEILYYF